MEYYVDINAGENGLGTKEAPFRHISDAASCAKPGDTVYVLPGVYRENVDKAAMHAEFPDGIYFVDPFVTEFVQSRQKFFP